ncbi:hypothetical protein M569_02458 [Genlisea aurea]|uniref:Uncharacterized protein n=1 Tax=Genlisea aurea TaxID=192259 RepID=S8D4K9_9LAMI|nr:hypothetical protein M569_02458 [Genlisea aurea]
MDGEDEVAVAMDLGNGTGSDWSLHFSAYSGLFLGSSCRISCRNPVSGAVKGAEAEYRF